jgi:UPF0755 protein
MRRRVSTLLFILLAGALMILACGSVWIVGSIFMGMPSASERIGAAAPNLDPIQQSLLSIYLVAQSSDLDSPAGDPSAAIDLLVEEGDTATAVIEQLSAAGVVKDSTLLRYYMRYRGFDVSVEVGRYPLHGGMTIRQLAEALQSAQPVASPFTVLEGWRAEEIATALSISNPNIDSSEFMTIVHSRPGDYPFLQSIPDPPSLEGYLFPDTYNIDPDATASDVVDQMLANFEGRVDLEIQEGIEAQGLTLHQAVTLASIIEREAVVPEEQPMIASVFLNRLALGMNLDADPTVQYALGLTEAGWWKAGLTTEDLEIDSPYNTYRYAGLPPGPIANPGLSALQAVAAPEDTPYLYFRALCDGSGRHAFATTFEEHLQNACP